MKCLRSTLVTLANICIFIFLHQTTESIRRINVSVGHARFWNQLRTQYTTLRHTSSPSSAEPDRLEITKFGFGGFFHFSNSAFFCARSRCLLSSSSIFCRRFESCKHEHRPKSSPKQLALFCADRLKITLESFCASALHKFIAYSFAFCCCINHGSMRLGLRRRLHEDEILYCPLLDIILIKRILLSELCMTVFTLRYINSPWKFCVNLNILPVDLEENDNGCLFLSEDRSYEMMKRCDVITSTALRLSSSAARSAANRFSSTSRSFLRRSCHSITNIHARETIRAINVFLRFLFRSRFLRF